MQVYPTKKWNRDIAIPKLGIVRRPYPTKRSPLQTVSSAIGQWLVENGYATLSPNSEPPQQEIDPPPETTPAEAPTSSPTPKNAEPIAKEETKEVAEEPPTVVSNDDISSFLKAASAEEIAETKGIGKSTAYSLLEKRAQAQGEIRWEDIKGVLSDRQLHALQERLSTKKENKEK